MSGILVNKLYDFKGHRESVYALASRKDGNNFFSAAGDGLVAGWDLNHPDQGSQVAKVPNSVYALHYMADKNLLAVGHNQDGLHLIDVADKKEVASARLTTNSIFAIQSFGKFLVVSDGDGILSIVDRNDLSVVKKIKASGKSARCLAINSKANEIAVGCSDHYIRIFSLSDFALKKEWLAHGNSVFTVQYTLDNDFLISGSRDARLKKWEVTSDYQLNIEVPAHLYAINDMALSPDGKHFITCSMDKTIKVWNTGSMKLLKVLDKVRHGGHSTSVNKVLWLSHNRLVSASDDRNISIWNIHFETDNKI
jgi:WD40 repeat protein